MTTPLSHFIYASAATCAFDSRALQCLLAASRTNNQRLGITGMLLFVEGSFFQVLEGHPEHIKTVVRSISADARHDRISRIIEEPIAERSFGDWSMGYADLSRHDLGVIAGANDFFGEALCFDRVDHGRARKLLSAFRGGRWRSRLVGTGTALELTSA